VKWICPIGNCTYAIRAKISDISQDFRLADILGIPQAIKGFDKPDFCEVFSIYLLQGGNYD